MSETVWCRSCGGEFHSWVTECPDCLVPLSRSDQRDAPDLSDPATAALVHRARATGFQAAIWALFSFCALFGAVLVGFFWYQADGSESGAFVVLQGISYAALVAWLVLAAVATVQRVRCNKARSALRRMGVEWTL